MITIEEYFGDWIKVIDKQELCKVINTLDIFYNKIPICPDKKDVFKAFDLCSLNNLKVVFLGQDPYPQKGVATGILFGNKSDVLEDDLSPSLQIIKRACIDYTIPHNNIKFDHTLESWSKQGILMINSALTCERNVIGSHVMLWRPFIAKLLYNLSNSYQGIIYVLFGNKAQTFTPYINTNSNDIIKIEHPAWFARTNKEMPNTLFKDINVLLKNKYGTTIKWYEEIE